MLAKHVQKCVTVAQTIARNIQKWTNAANCAGPVRKLAANVQKNAKMVALLPHNNVLMPVVPVQKNAKNTIMNIVSVVQKNAESAKKSAKRLLLKVIY